MPTFTPFDPTRQNAIDVIGALLPTQPGLTVVTGSGQLHYGMASSDRSPFDGLIPAQIQALIKDPAAHQALLNNPPAPSLSPSVSFYDGSLTALGIGSGLLLTSDHAPPPLSNTSSGYVVGNPIALDFGAFL